MVILVINAGSSSVKFTCFNMADNKKVLASGLVERIGIEGTTMKYTNHKGDEVKGEVNVKNPTDAIKLISERLLDAKHGVLTKLDEIKAIGHRVVHGGEKIKDPIIITAEVKDTIKGCFSMSPLHNPHNLNGIEACEGVLPGVPNVGVFDTAFHATMPPHAYLYGLPYNFYSENSIRRYGFHGTSHAYVSKAAATLDGRPYESLKIVTCHLGNGGSVAAIKDGKCQDTSMGLTPLEGLLMGTRLGDVDPAVVLYVMKLKNLTIEQMDNLMNKQSGVLGLAGIGSSDLRDVEAAQDAGNAQCRQALDAYAYRVRKYIGAYTAALGGLDILVFTAGVGENSATMRASITKDMEGLGIKIDPEKNKVRSPDPRVISTSDSAVKVQVVPTNEELAIAEFTHALVAK
ncbi:MAG: acetate kinase [Deltaproteobacteria bacterium]|jgi:acetate kinase|nr:acetate kinase [Deltaproteobacteria bacterium]